MPDLTPELLGRIQAYRLPGIDLGEGLIYPNYIDQSILNIPSSVCWLLGLPGLGAGPLIPEILSPLGGQARSVILVLMDALSFDLFRRWLAAHPASIWNRLAEAGVLAPVTSVTPSTTSAAITTLWTGRSPAEHGIVGYELWLKEFGLVANMITHRPMSFTGGAAETLALAGFEPEAYLPFPTMGEHLTAHGVKTYVFQHHSIARSGLSRMFFKEVVISPVATPADLWINVRNLLEAQRDQQTFVWVYWGEVDHFSHFYGPEDERPAAEFAAFSAGFEELLLSRLSPGALRDTVLILTADHGQILTHKNPHYELRNHPNLIRRLHIYPTGENRLLYLYPRVGQVEAVREYIERTWPRQFSQLDSAFAIESGLFGPGQPHLRLLDRLGDVIVAARNDAYLWWSEKENILSGRHGGLSPEEMLVPLVAARLG